VALSKEFDLRKIYESHKTQQAFSDIKSVENCKSLQADIESVQHWCGENHMELKFIELKLYFSHVRPTVSILITMSVMFQLCVLTV
jgi:hypothetical protein